MLAPSSSDASLQAHDPGKHSFRVGHVLDGEFRNALLLALDIEDPDFADYLDLVAPDVPGDGRKHAALAAAPAPWFGSTYDLLEEARADTLAAASIEWREFEASLAFRGYLFDPWGREKRTRVAHDDWVDGDREVGALLARRVSSDGNGVQGSLRVHTEVVAGQLDRVVPGVAGQLASQRAYFTQLAEQALAASLPRWLSVGEAGWTGRPRVEFRRRRKILRRRKLDLLAYWQVLDNTGWTFAIDESGLSLGPTPEDVWSDMDAFLSFEGARDIEEGSDA